MRGLVRYTQQLKFSPALSIATKSAAISVLIWLATLIATTPASKTAHTLVDRVREHSSVVRMALAIPNPALAEQVSLKGSLGPHVSEAGPPAPAQ
jgi:hypothetical protein